MTIQNSKNCWQASCEGSLASCEKADKCTIQEHKMPEKIEALFKEYEKFFK